MEKGIKICGYRNCGIELNGKRKNAKFCCRSHKQYEKEYRDRFKKNLEKLKNNS